MVNPSGASPPVLVAAVGQMDQSMGELLLPQDVDAAFAALPSLSAQVR